MNGILKPIIRIQMSAGYSDDTPRISCTQTDDKLITAILNLRDREEPYVVPEGYEVKIRAKKPDGTVIFTSARKEDGQWVLDIGGQLTTAIGTVDAQLEVVYGTSVLNSAEFKIIVKRKLILDAEIVSKGDLSALNEYVTRSETAAKNAEQSESASKQSETNAAKSAEFADTTVKQVLTSVEDAAKSADSARLDADRADTAKTGAEGSAGVALKAKQDAKTARDSAQSDADAAEKSAQNAKLSEDNARGSQDAAKASEDNSKASETNADTDAQAAKQALSDLLRMLGNDIATLVDGKIPVDQIPSIATTEIYVCASQEEQDAIVGAENGDILVRTDEAKSYIWKDTGWVRLVSPTDYSAKAGYAETAGVAENSNKINNHRMVEMEKSAFDTAVKDPGTYYLVYDPASEV